MAKKKDSPFAIHNYVVVLCEGNGIEPNKEKAAKLFKLSIQKRNYTSLPCYTDMLYSGDGIPQNKKKAFNYYLLSADHNHDLYSIRKAVYMMIYGDGCHS